MGPEDVSIESYLLSSLAKQEEALKGLIESRAKPYERRVINPLDMTALSTVIGGEDASGQDDQSFHTYNLLT